MATWQCDFQIVPSAAPVPAPDDAWLHFPPPEDWREKISGMLQPGDSWHQDLVGWGPYDGNRVEGWLETSHLASMRARLDLRDPNLEAFVLQLLALLPVIGASLETHYGTRLPSSLPALTEAIQGSPAFRFVTNPEAFLRRLRLGGPDDA